MASSPLGTTEDKWDIFRSIPSVFPENGLNAGILVLAGELCFMIELTPLNA